VNRGDHWPVEGSEGIKRAARGDIKIPVFLMDSWKKVKRTRISGIYGDLRGRITPGVWGRHSYSTSSRVLCNKKN